MIQFCTFHILSQRDDENKRWCNFLLFQIFFSSITIQLMQKTWYVMMDLACYVPGAHQLWASFRFQI